MDAVVKRKITSPRREGILVKVFLLQKLDKYCVFRWKKGEAYEKLPLRWRSEFP